MPTFPVTLGIGQSLSVSLKFMPTTPGIETGSASIVSDAPDSPKIVGLVGTGTSPLPPVTLSVLSTSGNQIVDAEGVPVRLRSVNWFGAEGDNYTPHGTWIRSYKSLIDQVVTLGFNSIRLPVSGDIITPGRMPLAINEAANPELVGLSAIQVIDAILDYCLEKGVYVVLDHHRRQAGVGADGSPVGVGYTLSDWYAFWSFMAGRYGAHTAVAGADLHNEPHDLTWGTWAGYAEGCASVINGLAPNWLIFVEGVGEFGGESYWWGGQLRGVISRPVVIPQTNKLVYSPHEYGQSVATGQSWLAYGGSVPGGWPNNLFAKWDNVWGFIFFEGIAPIWIGEFGGKFGYDGSGTDMMTPYRDEERVWLATLSTYLNGDSDGDGFSNIGGEEGALGASYAYWSLNPNSGDTGGLLEDDWLTAQAGKITLLEPLLEGDPPPPPVTVLLVDDDDEQLVDDDDEPLEDG